MSIYDALLEDLDTVTNHFGLGYKAASEGRCKSACPYYFYGEIHQEWLEGYEAFHESALERLDMVRAMRRGRSLFMVQMNRSV